MSETCPQCGSDSFGVARDGNATRRCNNCGNMWTPISIPQNEQPQPPPPREHEPPLDNPTYNYIPVGFKSSVAPTENNYLVYK